MSRCICVGFRGRCWESIWGCRDRIPGIGSVWWFRWLYGSAGSGAGVLGAGCGSWVRELVWLAGRRAQRAGTARAKRGHPRPQAEGGAKKGQSQGAGFRTRCWTRCWTLRNIFENVLATCVGLWPNGLTERYKATNTITPCTTPTPSPSTPPP